MENGGMGTLVLLGSGETSSQGRKIHDYVMARLSAPPVRVALVETPAGFQPNAHLVYQKVGQFLQTSLQNFRPQVQYVQVHHRAQRNEQQMAAPLHGAQYVFAGPGSPTYAARHLRGTETLRNMVAAYGQGAGLVLSSAAAIAVGSYVMRVYEIFKAGADLGWDDGLHLLPMLGLDIDPVIVTHWNNTEGGAGLDTSHCYVGVERFRRLMQMLPPETPVLGIDEHTACVHEPGSDSFLVMGAGSATVIAAGETIIVPTGGTFPVRLLKGLAPAA